MSDIGCALQHLSEEGSEEGPETQNGIAGRFSTTQNGKTSGQTDRIRSLGAAL